MSSFVQKLISPFQKALRQSLSSFIQLETADGPTTLVSTDGSLLSYMKIEGSRQIIGEEEYNHIIHSLAVKVGSRFDAQGHALQVYFARDPFRARGELTGLVRPSFISAKAMQMEIADLLNERVTHLEKMVAREAQYFVLWTRASILTPSEYKRAGAQAMEKRQKWVVAPNSQDPLAALDPLRTRHKSFVAAISSALNEAGIRATLLKSHDALNHVRTELFPERANPKWKPCLPGDKIPMRAPTNNVDMSDILWPNLPSQLIAGDAKVLGKSIVRIGDTLWAGADMTLAPMDAMPFSILMQRFVEAGIPFRISFLIEGGGIHATQMRTFLASIMGVTNALNKQIKFALEGLQTMSRSEPVVRFRCSFATWCPVEEKEVILDRLSVLLQSVESWGYCQVSEFSGDPLDCVMSSAMGVHCSGTAPTGIGPLVEMLKLVPWGRPCSPFEGGSMLFRTPDGKVWPYQTGTSLTTTWFDLIFAQPGAGKSVLMNTLNLGTCLSAGLSELPYVAVVDIGPSSSGLVSLIKEALPLNRQHEAAYYRLQMSHQYSINPFDTALGSRKPLPDERSFLTELVVLLCTPPGQEKPYDGMQQLAGLVVDEMYRWRDDREANAEARPYLPRLEADVDEALQKHNVHLPEDPYWWDIVDKMFDLEEYHIANMAQRHAVPTLNDAITASRRPQIRNLLQETAVGFSSETVIGAFERMVTSAIREYPILSSVTQFDIADARLCSLDLMDVSPQGDEGADRQTSIMYMLARNALVRSWWMGEEMLKNIDEKYREYHRTRLQNISESPKRLCFDEFHRTSNSHSVKAQIIRDVREGRKRGVQIVLASQLLDDFSKDMVDLATGVWIMGTALSDKAVDNVQDRFGLTQTARDVIRHKLTGPSSKGAPCLLVLGTKSGRYEQHLYNTLGPIELWALSTSAEDVSIRTRLYNRIGAGRARIMLASSYPGGSAREDIRKRVLARSEDGDDRSAMTAAIIEEIVDELVDESKRQRQQEFAANRKAMSKSK